MRILRSIVTAAVPAGIALVAFLNANALSALVGGTIAESSLVTEAKAGSARDARSEADARAAVEEAARQARAKAGAEAILDRNPFDHLTGPLRRTGCADTPEGCGDGRNLRNLDPRTAPLCEGVRPVVLVGDEDQKVAFASLDYGGKRILRRQGGDVGDARVAYVGRDRIWLEGGHGLCQALLFGAPPPPPPPPPRPGEGSTGTSALESAIGKQISRTGPNEYSIDRSAVDRILEAQQELMKSRLLPEKEGDRIVGMKILGIKPGSILAMLGIENGDRLETINGFEVSSPEKMLEAYARLRSGAADKLTVHLTRGGKPVNVDYVVR